MTVMYTGRAPEAVLRAMRDAADRREQHGLVVRRLLPGILTDGVALADAGWPAVTLSRGDRATLRESTRRVTTWPHCAATRCCRRRDCSPALPPARVGASTTRYAEPGMIVTTLLALALFAALLLVPLGLPGLWVMLGVGLLYDLIGVGNPIGTWVLVGATALAAVAELLEFLLGGRMTRRYGGSRRAEWGAILGGFAGAIVGVPVPVIGPMIGAFAGAFAGALAAELSLKRRAGDATRVATGALVGRAIAVVVKVGIGSMIAIWLLWASRH